MFNKIKSRKIILIFVLIIITLISALILKSSKEDSKTNVAQVSSTQPKTDAILAGGSVVSGKQETLHFLVGGKLVFLPFAEGDSVAYGQTIASLDSLEAQKNVTAQEAVYRSAKAALDLVLDNIHLFQYGNGGFANVGSANETQTQKTQRQQAEEAVNVAYDNLQKAKKQLENSFILAPFDGTLVHEDVKEIGINITPQTSFVIADLGHLVFQAQLSNEEIGYINIGDMVSIELDSFKERKFSGSVSKIYPEKIKLPSGADGYKVDIESADLATNAKYGLTGSALFENKSLTGRKVVPAWTVLENQYVWVLDGNTPTLRKVKTGETFADITQIIEGLKDTDKVILNPEIVIKKDYKII